MMRRYQFNQDPNTSYGADFIKTGMVNSPKAFMTGFKAASGAGGAGPLTAGSGGSGVGQYSSAIGPTPAGQSGSSGGFPGMESSVNQSAITSGTRPGGESGLIMSASTFAPNQGKLKRTIAQGIGNAENTRVPGAAALIPPQQKPTINPATSSQFQEPKMKGPGSPDNPMPMQQSYAPMGPMMMRTADYDQRMQQAQAMGDQATIMYLQSLMSR